MPDEVRLWQVEAGEQLRAVARGTLDLESRLQEWLAQDVSILDSGLLVIGREVGTAFGGFIDILCIDELGNLVIVELKRDKTPREVVAQALDYASWVSGLSYDQVAAIAGAHHGAELEEIFRGRFGVDPPETLNGEHRILIVGSAIDAASERIIKYLSGQVSINAATFQYFQLEDGPELLSRIFLIEPSEVEPGGSSKRRPNLTYEELDALAVGAGVEDLYRCAVSRFEPVLQKHRTMSSVGFSFLFHGGRKTVISLLPGESNVGDGLFYRLYKNRYAELTTLALADAEELMPQRRAPWSYGDTPDADWHGYEGFITSRDEIDRIAAAISGAQSSDISV